MNRVIELFGCGLAWFVYSADLLVSTPLTTSIEMRASFRSRAAPGPRKANAGAIQIPQNQEAMRICNALVLRTLRV
jgi:hypothetical protein